MKFSIATTLMLLFAGSANADIIRCSFTEPFFSIQYSTTTSEMRVTGPETNLRFRNISFQIRNPGRFELLNSRNQRVMTLNLNFRGSDGMSDYTYPYTARLSSPQISSEILTGGCESNFLHKTMNSQTPSN